MCGEKTRYMSSDLRPVFPEERLLMEILQGVEPNTYAHSSVWAENNRYYIDGKATSLPMKLFQTADTDAIGDAVRKYQPQNDSVYFMENIQLFFRANANRLDYLKDEAHVTAAR